MKQFNLFRSILADRRLAGFVVVSFITSLLYFCCCGFSCANVAIEQTEPSAHCGCCLSEPAPAESPNKGCCGDACDCTLKGEQDTYVLTEAYPVPAPELHARPPIQYADSKLHALDTFPIIGKTDLSRAPPLYLRFQILLI